MLDPQFREDVSALFRELHAMVAAGEKRLAQLEHAVLPTWTTRDGRVLLLRDMTDEHLANTIIFCEARPTVAYEDEQGYDVMEPHQALDELIRERDRRKA